MSNTKKPEKMHEFFNKRATSYEHHMENNVNNFENFYKKIAKQIIKTNKKIKILDIGCGTGLELKYIFKRAPNAQIMGVDISYKMLEILLDNYKDKASQISVINDSYLTLDFCKNKFDYIISVMSVHHLLYKSKIDLYTKLLKSLKDKGKYIEGDYIVSEEKEKVVLKKYKKQLEKEDLKDGFFHIDIPFSLETQRSLLNEAGFKEFNLIYKKNETAIYTGIK